MEMRARKPSRNEIEEMISMLANGISSSDSDPIVNGLLRAVRHALQWTGDREHDGLSPYQMAVDISNQTKWELIQLVGRLRR